MFGIDDVAAAAIMNTAANVGMGIFGGDEQKFVPQEQTQVGITRLMPQSEQEAQLSQLAQMLAYSLMMSDYSSNGGLSAAALAGGNVGGVNAGSLMRGELDQATKSRLEEMAYGGLEEAGQRISAGATESAMGRGLGMSSIRDKMQGEMMQPIIAQAGKTYGSLYQDELMRQSQERMAELQRQERLRQTALQNSLMIQQSPALESLLRIRMAQPMSASYGQTVQAGKGYNKGFANTLQGTGPENSYYQDSWMNTRNDNV